MNIHTAEFNGKTYTRTSQSRAYTHCVAVVRPAHERDGYTSPAWEGVETWCGSLDLARKAAATLGNERHYNGTEGRRNGRRAWPKGNGPAVYSKIVILPVTLTTKTPKPAKPFIAAKATAARRAARSGKWAIWNFQQAQDQTLAGGRATTYHVDAAADAAKLAWHEANDRLTLDGNPRPAADPDPTPEPPAPVRCRFCGWSKEQHDAKTFGTCGRFEAEPADVAADRTQFRDRFEPVSGWTDQADLDRNYGAWVAAGRPATWQAMGLGDFMVVANGVAIGPMSIDAARHVAQVHQALGQDVTVTPDFPIRPVSGTAAVRRSTCVDCGTELVSYVGDSAGAKRCVDCWRKTPADVIIRESKQAEQPTRSSGARRRPFTRRFIVSRRPGSSKPGLPVVIADGGRAAAGFKGQAAGDCVTRAIAIATGMAYLDVYNAINAAAAGERATKGRRGRKSSARTGVFKPTYRRLLDAWGWTFTPTMGIGTGCTVHLAQGELPATGRLIVALSKHLVAVIDGTVYDVSDPTRGGTRCVYGYFTKGGAK